jgi:hypothetical protein
VSAPQPRLTSLVLCPATPALLRHTQRSPWNAKAPRAALRVNPLAHSEVDLRVGSLVRRHSSAQNMKTGELHPEAIKN